MSFLPFHAILKAHAAVKPTKKSSILILNQLFVFCFRGWRQAFWNSTVPRTPFVIFILPNKIFCFLNLLQFFTFRIDTENNLNRYIFKWNSLIGVVEKNSLRVTFL